MSDEQWLCDASGGPLTFSHACAAWLPTLHFCNTCPDTAAKTGTLGEKSSGGTALTSTLLQRGSQHTRGRGRGVILWRPSPWALPWLYEKLFRLSACSRQKAAAATCTTSAATSWAGRAFGWRAQQAPPSGWSAVSCALRALHVTRHVSRARPGELLDAASGLPVMSFDVGPGQWFQFTLAGASPVRCVAMRSP